MQEIQELKRQGLSISRIGELTGYAGRAPNGPGSRDCVGFTALDRYYRCADGWLTLACTNAVRRSSHGRRRRSSSNSTK